MKLHLAALGWTLALGALLGPCWACLDRQGTPPDELVFALGSNPTNLDPRFAPDAFSDRIARLIFSPLLERGADGLLHPHLAESIETPDDRSYLLRLRPDATFHDGSPVRASDVRATYESILDPDLRTIKRLFLQDIDRIETPDDLTVIFRLKRPHAPFPQILASIGIAPAASLEEHGLGFSESLIGSGPFLFEEQRTGEYVLLRRNPSWFGGEVLLPRLRFRVIPDATVRVLEVLHGSADLVQNDLPPHVIERLATEEDLRVQTAEGAMVKYLAFNMEHTPLGDVRVRRAIALAIDRAPILKYKLRGFGTPATSFLHPSSWAYEPNLPSYPHDPDKARALLDEAGHPRPEGGGPRFTLVYRTSMDTTAIAIAKILRRQLSEVGIEIDLRTNEWGVFFSDIKQGRFDLFSLNAVGINDPDWYTYLFHSRSIPPGGANRAWFRNERMDELLDAARSELKMEERARAYREVQRIAADQLPYLPLWYDHNITVARKEVRGYELRADGEFSSLVKTQKVATP